LKGEAGQAAERPTKKQFLAGLLYPRPRRLPAATPPATTETAGKPASTPGGCPVQLPGDNRNGWQATFDPLRLPGSTLPRNRLQLIMGP